jgi:polyisoprenoid-binding protein YceI
MIQRLTLIAAALLPLSAAAQLETWQIDPAHSASQFAVRHFAISTVRGVFAKTAGTVQYDPADPAKMVIDVSIDAASVDTRVQARDNDLRSAHFLDVEKYPAITFKSKRVEPEGKGKLKITGDLTIHGITKEVALQVEGPSGPIKDPRGNQHIGASASTQISRKDFGINGSPGAVGDDVVITIDVEMVKQAASPPPSK